jgi:hypothetical protein
LMTPASELGVAEIRKRLKACGLSTKGEKKDLIAR